MSVWFLLQKFKAAASHLHNNIHSTPHQPFLQYLAFEGGGQKWEDFTTNLEF